MRCCPNTSLNVQTLVILGLWLENKSPCKNVTCAEALARGFASFSTFLGVSKLDAERFKAPMLKKRVKSLLKTTHNSP
jgi:hypothetical protein